MRATTPTRSSSAAIPRSPSCVRRISSSVVLNFFGVLDVWHSMSDLVRNAAGNVSDAEKSFIPEQEWPKVVRAARVHLAIYVATIALALCDALMAAADDHRPAAHVRRLAHGADRPAAAWRARRQRHRPPAEFAHRLHEPGQPLPLHEHELPCGAPHVPDGALSCAAEAARADQARPAGAQPVHAGTAIAR